MSYFSQRGHEKEGDRAGMRRWLLGVTVDIWSVFRSEFSRLWHSERTGILYQRSLFEERGDALGSEQALDLVLAEIWTDLLGFAGVEMHRRILGLAHNADFETIADADLRAALRDARPCAADATLRSIAATFIQHRRGQCAGRTDREGTSSRESRRQPLSHHLAEPGWPLRSTSSTSAGCRMSSASSPCGRSMTSPSPSATCGCAARR